jgi:hypothetical protein
LRRGRQQFPDGGQDVQGKEPDFQKQYGLIKYLAFSLGIIYVIKSSSAVRFCCYPITEKSTARTPAMARAVFFICTGGLPADLFGTIQMVPMRNPAQRSSKDV